MKAQQLAAAIHVAWGKGIPDGMAQVDLLMDRHRVQLLVPRALGDAFLRNLRTGTPLNITIVVPDPVVQP